MKVIYPGTFDPITFGHIDIIRQAHDVFEELQIAVVKRSGKKLMFSIEERVNLVKLSLEEQDIKGVEVNSFDSLLVDYLKQNDCKVFIRGLRANSDFEYEFQMHLMNRRFAPDINGLYLMPSANRMYLSSTLVREIAMFSGDLSALASPCVIKALEKVKSSGRELH